jgi:dihydrofolate synthase/folylpolyglutamate synthase
MVSEEFVVNFVKDHQLIFKKIKPSFFEMTIAMTFAWFAEQKVDIAIIETGLGGRLDSTNIITPELSVITNVGLDHMNLLGNTIEDIAREKAGIIKPGIAAVAGKSRSEAMKVFREKARETESVVFSAEHNFDIELKRFTSIDGNRIMEGIIHGKDRTIEFQCPLTGTYQLENICTVVQAVEVINQAGRFSVSETALQNGLKNVVKNTGMAGRWQVLSQNPLVICDTGHNADGMRSVVENIKLTPHKKLHFVLGMMNDKDVSGIFKLLPAENTQYYFCRPDVPRGLDVNILHNKALELGFTGEKFESVKDALLQAKKKAAEDDLIFVGGSTFVVAEIV